MPHACMQGPSTPGAVPRGKHREQLHGGRGISTTQTEGSGNQGSYCSRGQCTALLAVGPAASASGWYGEEQGVQQTVLVGPDGEVLGGWAPGRQPPPGSQALRVISVSNQCKAALCVGSEAEYAHCLVQWCNSGDAGLGVILRAMARIAATAASQPDRTSGQQGIATQCLSISTKAPWPRHPGSSPSQLMTVTVRSLQFEDSSHDYSQDYQAPDRAQQHSTALIMLEHDTRPPQQQQLVQLSAGGRVLSPGHHTTNGMGAPSPRISSSWSMRQQRPLALSGPQHQQLALSGPAASQRLALSHDTLRSMLVASEVPCMLTLITAQVRARAVLQHTGCMLLPARTHPCLDGHGLARGCARAHACVP